MNEAEFRKAYGERQEGIRADEPLKERTAAAVGAAAAKQRQEGCAGERPNRRFRPVRRGSAKKWLMGAAACVLAVALAVGLPPVLSGGSGGAGTLGPLGFSVQAYASDTNTLLEVGKDGRIVFSRADVNTLPQADYAQAGVYTGCLFTVEGEGIVRMQASIESGELYRYTYEEFTVGDEPERWAEAWQWKPTKRGLGEYYGSFDNLETVLAGNGLDWGRKKVTPDQTVQVRLTKRFGPVIDVPVDSSNPATACFGLWTNEPYEDGGDPMAKEAAPINTFDGKKLTVTVEFEDGRTSTQAIELHAADFRAERVPDAIGAQGPGLKLVPEVVDPSTLGTDERTVRSLYGEVVESSDGAFPGSLENANARENIVDDWGGFERRELYTSMEDKTIREDNTYSAQDAIPVAFELEDSTDAELAVRLADIERSTQLPEGVVPADLVPGMFGDTEYANRCSEQVFGYQVSNEGVISEGFSFVTVDLDITNNGAAFETDAQALMDGWGLMGDLVVLDDGVGHYSQVLSGYSFATGKAEVVQSRGSVMAAFAEGETKRMRYVLPIADEALDNPSLMLLLCDMAVQGEASGSMSMNPVYEEPKALHIGDLI